MNPLTNVRNISNLNEQDLKNGIFDHRLTWHAQYKDSAYIFVGGLPYDLTEGDILCVFSQYGEIVNINLVRDKSTGKSKGYCFICYEDQRSTILAVDNFNSIKLGGRTIRVDHVSEYRTPKGDEKDEDGRYKDKVEMGCAPKALSPEPDSDDHIKKSKHEKKKRKKEKKEKKKKKKIKKEKESESDSSDYDDKKFKDSKQTDKHDKLFRYSGSIKKEETEYDSSEKQYSRKDDVKSKSKSGWDQIERHKHSPSLSRRRDKSPFRNRRRSRSRSRDR